MMTAASRAATVRTTRMSFPRPRTATASAPSDVAPPLPRSGARGARGLT